MYNYTMFFEWDELKNQTNIQKHDISFDEAQNAFFDQNRIILLDTKHSQIETRYFCLGKIKNNVLTVRFTIRNDRIRIFGAGFWREGKKIYDKKNNI